MVETSYEIIEIKCPYCGKNVGVKFANGGGGIISSPDYDLIADCVYHNACWDELVAKYPPEVAPDETA